MSITHQHTLKGIGLKRKNKLVITVLLGKHINTNMNIASQKSIPIEIISNLHQLMYLIFLHSKVQEEPVSLPKKTHDSSTNCQPVWLWRTPTSKTLSVKRKVKPSEGQVYLLHDID